CAAADKLDDRQRVRFGNELTRFHLSQILHGEQGALSLSASLCLIFRDPGAQEYAANQAREEARHVHALSRYFAARWGEPVPVGGGLMSLMTKLVLSGEVYQKIIGMQMLIEGLALGAFAAIHKSARDPVLRRLVQLILTDESYHHRFGRIWGGIAIPTLTEAQHRQVENWAAGCFVTVFQNLSGIDQKQSLYERFGLDWRWVAGAIKEASAEPGMRAALDNNALMYRVLAKTLEQAGIVTGRTRPLYKAYFNLDSLADDPGDLMGQGIADQTLLELREIHEEIRRVRPGSAESSKKSKYSIPSGTRV
ncbi:MAG TPA: ferritin-like domain-containing protein, partial [Bryobacteraceae bacterium]|nr:ferritin-like domain-containing protein [Bryobacteraceae bacterium]